MDATISTGVPVHHQLTVWSRGIIMPAAPAGKVIPLVPGVSRSAGDRRVMLREAVIQVLGHLVLRAVPPSRRLPLFEQALGLLDEAGWGLNELSRAAEPGPARDELLRVLGLLELPTAPRRRAGASPVEAEMRDRRRAHRRGSPAPCVPADRRVDAPAYAIRRSEGIGGNRWQQK